MDVRFVQLARHLLALCDYCFGVWHFVGSAAMTIFRAVLAFMKRQQTAERPKTEEEKRAEYWAAVVWPATWNRIQDLSRHHP